MPVYNKLVRDQIPEIIALTRKQFSTRILENQEYISELKKKSREELEEYMNTDSNKEAIEELADLLEVIKSLAKVHGSSIEEVEKVRNEKFKERGGFDKKILLIEVED
ncbi:nucleoside triphosphate pyrophosphohydrolase [Robertmurraya sp. P23]|uniref:nucleoside triphosphate pyrophosphohydrolase n=1 Tax=Robertmurraya sp. P23 TaxID=3436931 RepID=UPI003D974002